MEQKDQLLHITLMDGMVRGLLLTATHTVAEAAAIHLTSPVATPLRSSARQKSCIPPVPPAVRPLAVCSPVSP